MASKKIPISLKQKNKGRAKKFIRNVLTTEEKTFWPQIPDDRIDDFTSVIERELCGVKQPNVKLPWYKLCRMTTEQRRLARTEAIKNLPLEEQNIISSSVDMKKHLTLGINSTLREVEQGRLLFFLLDPNVDPTIHKAVLALSQAKRVPAGLLAGLKALTKRVLGFQTVCLGFRLSVAEATCPLHGCAVMQDMLRECHPPPEVGDDPSSELVGQDHPPASSSVGQDLPPSSSSSSQPRLTFVHLKRTSADCRVFVPKHSQQSNPAFISLSSVDSLGDISTGRYFHDRQQAQTTCNTTHRGDTCKEKKDTFKDNPRYITTKDNKNFDNNSLEETVQIFKSPVVITMKSNIKKKKCK